MLRLSQGRLSSVVPDTAYLSHCRHTPLTPTLSVGKVHGYPESDANGFEALFCVLSILIVVVDMEISKQGWFVFIGIDSTGWS